MLALVLLVLLTPSPALPTDRAMDSDVCVERFETCLRARLEPQADIPAVVRGCDEAYRICRKSNDPGAACRKTCRERNLRARRLCVELEKKTICRSEEPDCPKAVRAKRATCERQVQEVKLSCRSACRVRAAQVATEKGDLPQAGYTRYVCKGDKGLVLQEDSARLTKGLVVRATGHCRLVMRNVAYSAPVIIQADEHAGIIIENSVLTGAGIAIHARDRASIRISRATLRAPVGLDLADKVEVSIQDTVFHSSEAAIRARGQVQVDLRRTQLNGKTDFSDKAVLRNHDLDK